MSLHWGSFPLLRCTDQPGYKWEDCAILVLFNVCRTTHSQLLWLQSCSLPFPYRDLSGSRDLSSPPYPASYYLSDLYAVSQYKYSKVYYRKEENGCRKERSKHVKSGTTMSTLHATVGTLHIHPLKL